MDASQIQQVLTNLIVNAVQAMPDGGRVEVGTDRGIAQPPPDHPGERGQYLRLWVSDNGPGIPEDDLPHISEPFFTTKDIGEGTGLGLSIAHGIVGEHGGWIEVRSTLGQGSCFSIYLSPEGAL